MMTTPPTPRFAVLTLAVPSEPHGYVIFDRHTGRITAGVYFVRALALEVAAFNEHSGMPTPEMTPTTEALGLLFPVPQKRGRSA
jgi:hypothetical protein